MLFRSSLATVKTVVTEKDLHVTTTIAQLVPVEADKVRIKQILVNLLSNAAKFTPARGRIHVEAKLNGGEVVVSVADSGIGIPKEEHEAIFDKFYQTGVTPKGVREGTGLGLAITKQLVEQHGGKMHLESAPGKGSRFTFRFPISRRSSE